MGFLGDLGKGFVRSAVNQVGRDTGKVFSNQIYGDAHSTPIRHVSRNGNAFYDNSTNEEITEQELSEMLKKEGYKFSYFNHGIFHHLFSFLGLFILTFIFSEYPVICVILTLGLATTKFVNIPNATFKKKESVPVYSSDRRYKKGYRIEGFTKETIKYKMPANGRQKNMNLIISIVYLAICSIVTYHGMNIGNDFHHYNVLTEHEKFLQDSAKTREDIEFWNGRDSAIYNRRLDEFNKQYQEAIDYIKKNNSNPIKDEK